MRYISEWKIWFLAGIVGLLSYFYWGLSWNLSLLTGVVVGQLYIFINAGLVNKERRSYINDNVFIAKEHGFAIMQISGVLPNKTYRMEKKLLGKNNIDIAVTLSVTYCSVTFHWMTAGIRGFKFMKATKRNAVITGEDIKAVESYIKGESNRVPADIAIYAD